MMVECAKVSRKILAQRAFDPYRGDPIFPARDDLNDRELEAFIRAKAETVYHPIGTCRMGTTPRPWSIRRCACVGSKDCA